MAQNFIESCREQGFLLPPDVREWLPSDHLAWFMIDAVGRMDLQAFYAGYRADGHGRAAYEPSMMVTLVLFADATKVRSSRAIEGHLLSALRRSPRGAARSCAGEAKRVSTRGLSRSSRRTFSASSGGTRSSALMRLPRRN